MQPRRAPVPSPVPTSFTFAHELPFRTDESSALLRQVPESPGVLALFGPDAAPASQPFLTRAANLRRRAARLLNPPPARDQLTTPDGTPLPSRRLNLRDRVARIAFTSTGSEFESLLLLYYSTAALFGLPQARHRLRLHTPFFVRFSAENSFPRLYVTNRLSSRSLGSTFGPFPSRLAAERYCEAVLDLFQIRRCWQDLDPFPEHPGCVYGEMRKCLAPCNLTCTPETYSAEAQSLQQFLLTRGNSLLTPAIADRDLASEHLDFERAADLHRRVEKIKAAIALADPVVGPASSISGLIIQPAAPPDDAAHTPEQAALFLLQRGNLAGPQILSTLGVRAVREQTSVGSSLFAQPLMLSAVPLPPEPDTQPLVPAERPNSAHQITPTPTAPPTMGPEERTREAIASLTLHLPYPAAPDLALLSDHLALFRRWYFRPEKQRQGSFLLPNPDGSWPMRRILNAAARAALGDPKPMQETDRDAARTLQTKLLHAGREDVERVVPVLGRRASLSSEPAPPPSSQPATFRGRRAPARKTAGASLPAAADKLPLP